MTEDLRGDAERLIVQLEACYNSAVALEVDGPGVIAGTIPMIRALIAQLAYQQEENAKLKHAIGPNWCVSSDLALVCALAAAHRSDSEDMEQADAAMRALERQHEALQVSHAALLAVLKEIAAFCETTHPSNFQMAISGTAKRAIAHAETQERA